MKKVKKVISFTLCMALVLSTFSASVFANETATATETVLAEYNFEDLTVNSRGNNLFGSGSAGDSNRLVVEGTGPSGTTGKLMQITYTSVNHKQKFKDMFANSRVGFDGIYEISFYAKADTENSAIANPYVYVDVFDSSDPNGFIREGRNAEDTPIQLTGDWQKITCRYDYSQWYYASKQRIADSFSLRIIDSSMSDYPSAIEDLTYTISSENAAVVLFDDVKVTEVKPATHTFDDPNYIYEEVAKVGFDNSAMSTYFTSGSSERQFSASYNYSGDTKGSVVFTYLNSGDKYRVRKDTESTGIISEDDLIVGQPYRYSVMARLADTSEVETAPLFLGLHATVEKANPGDGKTTDNVTIYKGTWTKLYFIDAPTSTAIYTSMAVQTPVADSSLKVVLDDFKIEKMISSIPVTTTFTYDGAEIKAISEEGDYTATVAFSDVFDQDAASVVFVKYLDGAISTIEVQPANLTSTNSKSFYVAENELDRTMLSVFVWSSMAGMEPIVDKLSIAQAE